MALDIAYLCHCTIALNLKGTQLPESFPACLSMEVALRLLVHKKAELSPLPAPVVEDVLSSCACLAFLIPHIHVDLLQAKCSVTL